MCLGYLTDFEVKENIGYKVFEKRGNELYPIFRGNANKEYMVNTLLLEKDFRPTLLCDDFLMTMLKQKYSYGFHIILDYTSAKILLDRWLGDGLNYVICKVKFSKIVAKGVEYFSGEFHEDIVVVVSEMTILNEIE
mgnify:FL=1